MDFNKLTEKSQEAVGHAQALASRRGHQEVDVEHLFLALLDQEGGLAERLLSLLGLGPSVLKGRLEQHLGSLPAVQGPGAGQLYVSPRLRKLFDAASEEASNLKDSFVSVEHLLLAIASEAGFSGKLLRESGATKERILSVLKDVRGTQRVTSQNPETTYEPLEQYGRDLTRLASQGKLDPVIGRDD